MKQMKHLQHTMFNRLPAGGLALMLLWALVLGACGSPGSAGTATPDASSNIEPTAAEQPTTGNAATRAPGGEMRNITVAMPYIPNVQFAYMYVADKAGYYAQEGLTITFDYNFETDVVQRVAQGTVQFGMASADSVLLARSQGLPVMTVATTSQRFPTVLYSKAEQNITTPADLRGKTVGIPGRFGASYIGLLALLYANKIPESDLNIQEIGFAQVPALIEDKAQVASGYGKNEPIQLEQQGVKVNVISVADSYPLASDGIIASEKLLADDPQLVQAFVRATMHGMQDVIDNPQAAFDTSLTYIPEAQLGDSALQRKVLDATIPYWQSDLTKQHGLGYSNPEAWQATATFLHDAGILKADVDVAKSYTNDLIAK
jgi:NitT/TauT family transport system substrate-binding protein